MDILYHRSIESSNHNVLISRYFYMYITYTSIYLLVKLSYSPIKNSIRHFVSAGHRGRLCFCRRGPKNRTLLRIYQLYLLSAEAGKRLSRRSSTTTGRCSIKNAGPIIEAAFFDSYFAGPQGEQRAWHFEHTPNSVWKNPNTLKHATGGGEVIGRHMAMQSKF